MRAPRQRRIVPTPTVPHDGGAIVAAATVVGGTIAVAAVAPVGAAPGG